MRASLHVRWASAIATLILAMATIVATLLLYNFQQASHRLTVINEQAISKQLMAQMLHQGRELSQQLSEKLTSPLHYHELHKLQQVLSVISGLHDVSRVFVFEPNGRIVQDGALPSPTTDNAHLSDHQLRQIRAGEPVEQRVNDQQYRFIHPIIMDDNVIGGVNLTLSFSETQNNINEMTRLSQAKESENMQRFSRYALVITLVMASIGAALALMMAHRHIRPIHRLVEFAQAIGNKNYQGPTTVERNDELGDLANALNQMANNLEHRSQQIEHLAYHDSLTGLPNRRYFTMMMEKALHNAQMHNQRLTTLCIGLDGFKRINDMFGHDTGNMLLNAVSQRIQHCFEQSPICTQQGKAKNQWMFARLGSDEFALFLQSMPNAIDASVLAQRVMRTLQRGFSIDEHEIVISASVGIATYPDNGKNTVTLLRNADIAMHRVKAEGKRDFKFYSQAMDACAKHRMSLETDLTNALNQNELDLYYQPIVNSQTGQIIGAEALLRWHSKRHGYVCPSVFIPIAEECGLIHQIGHWIISTALTQLASWNKQFNENFKLSVNVSAAQLQKANLADTFANYIATQNINPANIHLEVTETSLIFNKQASIKVLDTLKNQGIKVWLDDFGTGYSSLSHLKLFNIDGVKIDRSFISDLEDNQEDRTLTSAIIAMAKALNLNIVAEGVENIAQWHMLCKHQDMYIQGYLVSKALTKAEFERLVFEQNNIYQFGRVDTVN